MNARIIRETTTKPTERPAIKYTAGNIEVITFSAYEKTYDISSVHDTLITSPRS